MTARLSPVAANSRRAQGVDAQRLGPSQLGAGCSTGALIVQLGHRRRARRRWRRPDEPVDSRTLLLLCPGLDDLGRVLEELVLGMKGWCGGPPEPEFRLPRRPWHGRSCCRQAGSCSMIEIRDAGGDAAGVFGGQQGPRDDAAKNFMTVSSFRPASDC